MGKTGVENAVMEKAEVGKTVMEKTGEQAV
jgi:hypothetical protein